MSKIITLKSGLRVTVRDNKRFIVLDRLGYPVEHIKGRTVLNVLRNIIHGRRIERIK